ncbi:MAG: zinc dependent phospholipase C family protein [Hymenobacteraceae bacterium]|nr:zinc dependent phospholipase C family protein [Hymenobacteraceae bacterium]MDX5397803.1 zinc dependent phospholipase C family protein [Hymenobacteraceae bacterium]MDX5444299.1 zinc dependent phospholipase C family protein [Hymenobacteraceae bacterium]MDX5513882.1 zinc dependent phospholipase C family protein [Hymenobacteraceae bacterium]
MKLQKKILLLTFLLFMPLLAQCWGFFAHQRINRLAVFTLPPEMIGFYKKHIRYITENAVNPDKRRYAVNYEAPRHYIDIDVYGDSAIYTMPRYWSDAVAKYTEDTLQAYGIVPWHINRMKYQLTEAFRARDTDRILRLSTEMGHYISDACVPLHTTVNYNGQLTGQHGIHGLWESRLPEVFAQQYDFFVGPPAYLSNPQLRAWDAVTRSHLALDSVLKFERELTQQYQPDKKYSFEVRGNTNTRVYSREFSEDYHQKLNGQVERQMRYAINLVASYWYTCWVDAGQPDLENMIPLTPQEQERLKMELQDYEKGTHKSREDEALLHYQQELLLGHSGCGH